MTRTNRTTVTTTKTVKTTANQVSAATGIIGEEATGALARYRCHTRRAPWVPWS